MWGIRTHVTLCFTFLVDNLLHCKVVQLILYCEALKVWPHMYECPVLAFQGLKKFDGRG